MRKNNENTSLPGKNVANHLKRFTNTVRTEHYLFPGGRGADVKVSDTEEAVVTAADLAAHGGR